MPVSVPRQAEGLVDVLAQDAQAAQDNARQVLFEETARGSYSGSD